MVLAGAYSATVLHPCQHPNTTEPVRLWAFPGQGTQEIGMGGDLYKTSDAFRSIVDRANTALLGVLGEGVGLKQLMFEGPQDQLTRTLHAQPAILTASIGLLHFLKEEGIVISPNDLMAGHSLGEWSAYVASGALTLEEGVLAVYWRGRYMEEAFPFDPKSKSPMAAVIGLSDDIVKSVCEEVSADGSVVVAANINDPRQIVISGDPVAVETASERLQRAGANRVVPLKVAAPFHSPLMAPVREKLEAKLSELGISIREPGNRIISNLTAEPTGTETDHLALLMGQITGSVLWNASMAQAWSLGALEMVSLQVAGRSVLAGFARNIFSREQPLQIVDPRVPAERHALRFAPGTITTTSYPDSPEEATRKLLLHGCNIPVIARTVKALMATERPEDTGTALLVVQNRYDLAREAGLREIEPFKDRDGVQETVSAWGLVWPPPELLNLPRQSVEQNIVRYKNARDEKKDGPIQEALEIIYRNLEERGLAPIDLGRLIYFVETRWKGDPTRLQKIISELQKLSTLSGQRLGLYKYGPTGKEWQGVDSWEKVMLVVDYAKGIEFERPGALNMEEGIG